MDLANLGSEPERRENRTGSSPGIRVSRLLALGSVGLVASCGAGFLGLEEGEPTPPPPTYEMAAGNTVAFMETVLPEAEMFLLHGTLPVPPGILFPDDTSLPIAVLDPDGSPVTTQVEVVSRYASATQGADVVELIAQVNRPEGSTPGDRLQYAVTALDTPVPKPTPPAPSVSALLDATASLPGNVVGLLSDSTTLQIRTRDVFGNLYTHDLLAEEEPVELLKHGYNATQVRTYGVMEPVAPVSGATATHPHLFGIHSYVTALREEPVVLLDLRLHNGFANTSAESELDDVINRIYFDTIEVLVPAGWSLVQCFEDSGLGTPYGSGGKMVFPLVAPEADGKRHAFPMGGQMVRRLALCPTGEETRARELLDQEGLAFAVPGFDTISEQDTWSWSNPVTARYLVQNIALPDLEFANLAYIRGLLASSFQGLLSSLETGTGNGGYPLQNGKLGWAHPYGVAYGGMTGGNEIHLFEGVDVIQARSVEGYRKYQLTHRMHTDRQPNVLYRKDGEHASLWDWFVENGEASYVPLIFYMKYLNGPDPIGVTNPPTFQIQAAYDQDLIPDYHSALLTYEPHDLQHLIRYTRSPKALVWIGNDSLAKDDLMAQAELVRLTYHPFYSDQYGNKVTTGMRADIEQTELNPGGAVDFGRGEGWATDTRMAAYAVASEEWRELEYPMLEELVEMLSAGQVPCTGHIMAFTSDKIFNGNYRVAQAYETSIVDNSIRGVLETAFRGRSAAMTALTESVLADTYYGFIAPTAWSVVGEGPTEQYAVAPPSNASVPYCNTVQQPDDGVTLGANKYQTWSTLGFAYDLTGDATFLIRAEEMIGGDLLTELLADGIENIQNRTALLSVVQAQNGML